MTFGVSKIPLIGFATFFSLSLLGSLAFIPGGVPAETAYAGMPDVWEAPLVLSQDGSTLASEGQNGWITVLDLDSGQEHPILGDSLGSGVALAIRYDGKILASARDGVTTLWDVAAGVELETLEDPRFEVVNRLAFSPGGEALAVVADNEKIAVWDLNTGAARSFIYSPYAVEGIAFSADGQFLTSFGEGSEIKVWNVSSGEEHLTLTSPFGSAITGLAFSPVGMALAAADQDTNISLWNERFELKKSLTGHEDIIKELRFSPDGATLASEGSDGQIWVWNAASGKERAVLPARMDAQVTGLAFSPDGEMLASVGENAEILLWEAASGRLIQVLAGHAEVVKELAFGSSGQTLASVATDGQVIVWDLATGNERHALQISALTGDVSGIPADPSPVEQAPQEVADDQIASAATGSVESAGDMASGEAKSVTDTAVEPESEAITALAVAPDGSQFASVSEDSSVRVWGDADEELEVLDGHAGAAATSVVFSPNGNELYSVGRDTQVRRWNKKTGALTQTLLAHEHPIRAVARSNNGQYVASAGEETRVMLWNAKKGKLAHILSGRLGHQDFVNALAFKPNGKELASAGADQRILRWDVKSGKLVDALLGHSDAVNTLLYSRNGKMLASGSSDGTVKIWDTNTGRQLQELRQGTPVSTIAISPNKKTLVSAGQDARIFVWDIQAGGKPIKILSGGTSYVNSLAFRRNGRLLAGAEDGTISVWNVESKQRKKVIKPEPRPRKKASRQKKNKKVNKPASRDKVSHVLEMPGDLYPLGDGLTPATIDGIAGRGADRFSGNLLADLAGRFLDWLVPAANAQALPDPDQGPGGPILVIDSASSGFGKYYAEILRTEGFNAFSVAAVDSVTAPALAAYDLVILAEMSLSAGQVTMFTRWVNAGGNLIAMRPDPQLTGLLGLTATGATLPEGYILVDTSAPPGTGIVAQTMQFHGTASRYDLNGATEVATLYADSATATTNPAVTLRDVGANGGQAAAFAYDLATSVVYTRQGNPAWANQERDGFAPQRSDDKYYGNAAGDPQADWVDLNKVAIPQADEQQRLLANLILHMNLDNRPIPRFWYFPRGEKAVVIMTGDDHGNNGTAGRWDQFLAASPAGCSVEDWECIRGTSYIFPYSPLTDAQAAAYEAQGFEVGLHVNTGCSDYSESQLETFYAQQIVEFSSLWPSVPPPTTQRHHCIAWTDWVTGAKVQLNHGVRLDTSYYFWPPSWVLNRAGFFNGSGMPMRFSDLDGTLIDVYQAASQMTDESGQQYPYTIDTLLDRALGVEGYYGAYTINAHTDVAQIPESDAVVASALARNVPVITSRQMLEWLDGRNSSSFGSIAWDGSILGFSVTAGTGANGLQALVPMYSDAGVVNSVTRNGSGIPFTSAASKGIEYASFAATDGTYAVTYGADTVAPTVNSMSPAAGSVDVSQGTSVSATFSEAMDATTINIATFQLLDAMGVPVAAAVTYNAGTRTATLTPSSSLEAEASYTAIIHAGGATDLAGNAFFGDVTWTFTTVPPLSCPCSLWGDTDVPANPLVADPNGVELGVKFRSDVDGFITGVRFYKGSGNTGTHVGNLWAEDGTLLATAIFTNETASGWQQVDFLTPVAINADTVYVASYYAPNGGYAGDPAFFAAAGVDNVPLHALRDGESGENGLYRYGSGGFPNQSYNSGNYWVDVVFNDTPPDPADDTTPPEVTATTPNDSATDVSLGAPVNATFSEAMDPATIDSAVFQLLDASNMAVPATVTYDVANRRATLTPSAPLESLSPYTAILTAAAGPTDLAGNALPGDVSWSFTTAAEQTCPCAVWSDTDVPITASAADPSAVELGVKFTSDLDGFITGIRFYKGGGNTGTHVGNLWTSAGTLLASATFVSETATGWQQVSFPAPVAITANTVYVASYHAPNGNYAADVQYFAGASVDNGHLHLLQDGASGGNGVYAYGSGGFPSSSWQATNYWVDVVFTTDSGPDNTPPTVNTAVPVDGAADVAVWTVVTATFSEDMDGATIDNTTFELRDGQGVFVGATANYNVATRTASLIPDAALSLNTQYGTTVKGGVDGVKDLAGNALASDKTWTFTTVASDPCATPANAVVAENCLVGNPPSEWDVNGAGDPSIQGFATDISVNAGETVSFKIDTNANDYQLDIYRMGYYGGDGARRVATVDPSATLPQNQPACLQDNTTALIDCGNWAVSATWNVPPNATSGIYFAQAVRTDTGGASHIVFIVRDDAGGSDMLFQTADTTWHAYNTYGGSSLYSGGPGAQGGAYKVSYNRPFNTRSVDNGQDWLFNAEYPMVRWLEANGYDVSYFTGVDTDRFGSLIPNHKVFLSVGHDEYWSGDQRANVEAARDLGVHLAFFSGNEVFWKTRWEDSIDGSGTPYRSLVCYKETHANAVIDPETPIWTGTWRDPRFNPPADGGQPENALTGTIFTVNDGATTSIQVPEADGKMRFWRNTDIASLAAGQTATLPFGTLGYEWDEDLDNGFRPDGLIRMSTTVVAGAPVLVDFGSTFGSGTATHHLTLYKHSSGALVFGSGTVQWPWGLDANHDRAGTPVDLRMQQATVNLFADMAAQPATLQTGLVAATASTDATAPSSAITSPAPGANLPAGSPVTITGTATDAGGGVVGGVEVSVDGGVTWHPADGRGSWSYDWTTPGASGSVTIKSRAADDSGNLETPSAGIDVTVGTGIDTTPPTVTLTTPADGATDVAVGAVVTATFSEAMAEASVNGNFELLDGSTVVPATVTYDGITTTATLTPNAPLAPSAIYTAVVGNGATDVAGNALEADVSWSFTTAAADTTPPTVTSTAPTAGATGVSTATSVTATFDEPMDAATVGTSTFELRDPGNTIVAATVTYNAATRTATLAPASSLAANTGYTATVKGGASGVADLAGNTLALDFTWSFTTAPEGSGVCATPCSLWDNATTPGLLADSDTSAVELGVKFQSDVDGFITGVRFYKVSTNTGTHVGSLWSSTGTLLAQATFTNETASGWQQVDFATPVAIAANTVYVASYHTDVGQYAVDQGYFASAYSNDPLRAPADGASGGNGVYLYGPGGFPTNTYLESNYWVDVVFTE